MRKNAADHLRLVKMEMDLRAINQIADVYEKKTSQRATRISDLAQAGMLAGRPADPDGFPYVLGEQGKAEPNPKSPLREEWVKEKKQRSGEVLK
jgi:hypothetical protein